jgi:hypothetical protein
VLLTLSSDEGGTKPEQAEVAYEVPALGQAKYDLELTIPTSEGQFELKATANCGKPWCPTVSRRRVTVAP